MQIGADQLATHLKRGLAPIYFVYGDEPLLVQEAGAAIRAAAQATGFAERQVLTVESGFDWNGLFAETQSLSLFAERRLLELRMPTGKPGEVGAKILVELAGQPPADTLLLVTAGKLEKQTREAKWAKALEAVGVVVAIYPLERAQWPGWIARRMAAKGLTPGPGVAELLAHHMEGNLLACAQEIDKMAMLIGAGPVSVDDIEGNLSDNARFNVFGLADTCLRGDAAAAVRILESLRGEGIEPVLVLWALAREVRELARMSEMIAAGQSPAAVLDACRVWAKRRPLVSQALKRLAPKAGLALVQRAARTDRVVKGRRSGNAWHELQCLALGLAGTKVGTCRLAG
jgi:DNA polymerase-3 subunit delta